jgi:general secretion pathway protein C
MNTAFSFRQSIDAGHGPASASTAWRHAPAVAAGVLWLAAGFSAGYWVLLAMGRTPVTAVPAAPLALPVADTALVARALGFSPSAQPAQADQASEPVASRFVLLGVAAVGRSGGAALIGLDGQPPRPYRVGAVLDGGLVLQSVSRTSARLGPALQGPATVELALPQAAAADPSQPPPN